MTDITGYIKKGISILLVLSVSGFLLLSGSAQEGRIETTQPEVQEKLLLLKKILNTYNYDRNQLGNRKTEVEMLRHKAGKAILSNVGVVMFSKMADVIRKFFSTPGPDGLLQDLLQELLFEMEPEQEEKDLIQFWMKRNFLRRKGLRKNYKLLENVLRAPLARFDVGRESFPNTEEVWKGSDGGSDSYLKHNTRRLRVIVHISKELLKQIEKNMGELEIDRNEVENEIDRIRSEKESPEITETGDLDKSSEIIK